MSVSYPQTLKNAMPGFPMGNPGMKYNQRREQTDQGLLTL